MTADLPPGTSDVLTTLEDLYDPVPVLRTRDHPVPDTPLLVRLFEYADMTKYDLVDITTGDVLATGIRKWSNSVRLRSSWVGTLGDPHLTRVRRTRSTDFVLDAECICDSTHFGPGEHLVDCPFNTGPARPADPSAGSAEDGGA